MLTWQQFYPENARDHTVQLQLLILYHDLSEKVPSILPVGFPPFLSTVLITGQASDQLLHCRVHTPTQNYALKSRQHPLCHLSSCQHSDDCYPTNPPPHLFKLKRCQITKSELGCNLPRPHPPHLLLVIFL